MPYQQEFTVHLRKTDYFYIWPKSTAFRQTEYLAKPANYQNISTLG